MWPIAGSVFFGWGLGANDTANIFGPSVTSGIIKYKTAIVLTSVFLFIGAILEGPKCMETVGSLSSLTTQSAFFAILASAIVIFLMTFFAIPASASQAIIGAITGIGIFNHSADFSKLSKIVICWICTPLGGALFSIFFYITLSAIFNRFISNIYVRNKVLLWAIVLAGCYGAYSLGANNTANVTGVYVGSKMLTPFSASLIGGISIVFGVITYSYKVMITIGKKIIPLDPFAAFVVTLANASVIHIFTQFSVPVSSSQSIVGAIVGVGIVQGFKMVSKQMISQISLGWVLTPVLAGLLSYVFVCIF